MPQGRSHADAILWERGDSPRTRVAQMSAQPETLQTNAEIAGELAQPAVGKGRIWRARLAALRRALLLVGALAIAYLLLGAGAPSADTLARYAMHAATAGWEFDLLGWEADALFQKAAAVARSPIAGMDDEAQSNAVRAYIGRAQTIAALEAEVTALMAQSSDAGETSSSLEGERAALEAEIAELRTVQDEQRPIAEAAIEHQITTVLQEMGIGLAGRIMPPVLFSFTESPKKLVISPRSRIITQDAMILNPGMPLEAVEASEETLEAENGSVSVYITPTGGMGAFPTMVVEDASLSWILSTVAHEWVHTYLAFFPLGFNYGIDQENTTINETVADIVGDEAGLRALERYYPELVPVESADAADQTYVAPAFDYRAQMAETRQVVDKLLYFGRADDAEHYMEVRRRLFVDNGYNLRKLNQAYFAFHGSYGTSAAADVSTPDALGPRVQLLRDLTGDAVTFLRTIRSITDRAGLEALIAEWTAE